MIVQNVVHDLAGDYFAVHDCFYGPAGHAEMTQKARQALYDIFMADHLEKLVSGCGLEMEAHRVEMLKSSKY